MRRVMSLRPFRSASASLVLALLAACGGDGAGNGGARNTPPTAAFTVLPDTGVAPLVVAFDASSSADADGVIAVYTWDFGDQSSPAMTVQTGHVYQAPGHFAVTLTVADNDGGIATTSRTVTVMPGAAATHYSVTEIPSLGGSYTEPRGINRHGQVVGFGYFDDSSTAHAFLYSDGVTEELGTLIGLKSEATAINDAGDIVGNYETADSYVIAFHYRDGDMQNLSSPSGPGSQAYDVNNAGDIAGAQSDGRGRWVGAVWWEGGVPTEIGTFGGDNSWALAVNERGQIAGVLTRYSPVIAAFLFTCNRVEFLRPLFQWSYVNQTVEAMNDNGDVVGSFTPSELDSDPLNPHLGYLYRQGTTTLLMPVSGDASEAHDINNAGMIVGWGTFPTSIGATVGHAFVWDEVNGMQDLNDLVDAALGLEIAKATAINDLGQITGYGYRSDNSQVALLLSPDSYD